MAYEKTPKLCAGTFFSLLTVAKKGGLSKEERKQGEIDGLSDPNMMEALFKIFSYKLLDSADETKSNDTSKIKNCKKDSTEWLPLNQDIFIAAIKEEFENDYYTLLKRAGFFIKDFLDTANTFKIKRIFRAILETIIKDDSINPETPFVVGANKNVIKKKDLSAENKYSYQTFFLGVWYYIVSNKIVNKDGRATIEEWFTSDHPQDPNKRFETDIGQGQEVSRTTFVLLSDNDDQLKVKTVQEEEFLLKENDYSAYVSAVKEKYSKVMTILYEQPQPFDKLFVCSDLLCNLYVDIPDEDYLQQRIMHNATAEKLLVLLSNRIIISGSGGLGKSMMMRHLTRKACDDYARTKMVPFFVVLRNYNEEEDLSNFIYNSTLPLHGMSLEEFKQILTNGKAIILFDGMDEIQSSKQRAFEIAIEKFTDRYSGNMFIISTRRFKTFEALSRFTFVSLMPLRVEQSERLIQNLVFDAAKIEAFLKQLKEKLYKTHKDFASNPLLLSILLLTFNVNAEIPFKMHVFYSKAYEALATRHDSNKGGFIREYRTHLTPDRFREYFTRFCALSYFEEKYEFDKEEYYVLFEEMKKQMGEEYEKFTATEFLDDMLAAVCVLYEEENKYHFVHRSFQEYFTACFLCRADNNLYYPNLCSFFNSDRTTLAGDATFDMFYDMDAKKVNEYLFLPYLESIFKPKDNDANDDNFIYFLKRMYPVIKVAVGDTTSEEDGFETIPTEYVYCFIKKVLGLARTPSLYEIPLDDDFVDEAYCKVDGEVFGGIYEIVYPINEGRAYVESSGGDPDTVQESGWDIKVDIEILLDEKDDHKEVYEFITNETGELHEEYNKVYEYYLELKKQKKTKPKGIKELFS